MSEGDEAEDVHKDLAVLSVNQLFLKHVDML